MAAFTRQQDSRSDRGNSDFDQRQNLVFYSIWELPWRFRFSQLAAVRSAVEGLPSEQRQAIAMAFFGGMTHMEIAKALNEPLGTTKARIRRGMVKLRESLQAYV